jgi:hypothetical protein
MIQMGFQIDDETAFSTAVPVFTLPIARVSLPLRHVLEPWEDRG